MATAGAHYIMTTAEQRGYRNGGQLQLEAASDVILTHNAGKSPRQAGDWAPLLEGPGKMSVAQVAALCQPQPIGLMAKSICGLGEQQLLIMQLLRVCV